MLQIAYTHVLGNAPGKRIGIVKYLDSGYYPSHEHEGYSTDSNEQIDQRVHELNAELGVSDEVAEAMSAGSMFGWACPAAKAARDFFGAPSF